MQSRLEASEQLNTACAPRGFAYAVTRHGHVTPLPLDSALAPAPSTHLLWVHIDARDPSCVAWLKEESGLSPQAVAALLRSETRPRAEPLGEGAIVNLRGVGAYKDMGNADPLVSLRLWAESGQVVSLSYWPLAAMPDLRHKVERGRVTDPGDLIAALVTVTTERLDPEVAALGDRLDQLEVRFTLGEVEGVREALADARLEAIDFRRFLAPQKDAIVRLAVGEFGWLSSEDRVNIRDAADRVARMLEEIDANRERAAVLSDQLFDLRVEEANQRSLLLSLVAAIFLPLTFMTGLFGMNVGGIPFAEDPHGFWWMTGISVGLGVLLIWYLHRRRWL